MVAQQKSKKKITSKTKSKVKRSDTFIAQKKYEKQQKALDKKIAAKKKKSLMTKLKLKKAKLAKAKKLRLLKLKKVKAIKLKAKKMKGTKKLVKKMKVGKANIILTKKQIKKTVVKKVTVESLLTKKDLKHIQENSLKNIAVKFDGYVFAVPQLRLVPKNAEIQRNSEGLVLGTKAIISG